MTTQTLTKPETVSSVEATELLGINYRQLDYWSRLLGDLGAAAGSGTRARGAIDAGRDRFLLVWGDNCETVFDLDPARLTEIGVCTIVPLSSE